MCSPATVEGDRVYTVTNRDEVVCLDLHGHGQRQRRPLPRRRPPHGPARPAAAWRPARSTPTSSGCWTCATAAGVRPHDSAHSSILLDGPYLYVNTSNGLTSKHDGVDKPDAPSLVVVDKATGRLVARDREEIGPRIFHCTWSSPALGEVDGRRLVFFCGGDGVCLRLRCTEAATARAQRRRDGGTRSRPLRAASGGSTAIPRRPRRTSTATSATAARAPATSRACPYSTTAGST